MKSFVKPRNKLTKREIVLVSICAFLASLLVVISLSFLILRSTGLKLRTENNNLNVKVVNLQGDLKDIGERLSGLSDKKVSNTDTNNSPVLNRIGITAVPGDTQLTVDTPSGWELIGQNRLKSGESTVSAQSESIDLFTVSNYKATRTIESFLTKSGQTAFLVFIQVSSENKGYLSVSFCNPETGSACSHRGSDGKYVFILAHAIKEGDQFVRDMDFNSVEGIKLLTDFKVMMKSLEIS